MSSPAEKIPGDAEDLDIGHGVTIKFFQRSDAAPEGPQRVGITIEHPLASAETGRCMGAAFWWKRHGEGGPIWTLNSLQPLDLSPSFLCHCGFHGFIRNGAWVPA